VDRVKKAIDRGVQFLRLQERERSGSWERGIGRKGGASCLAVLALLNAGVPPEDEAVRRGLDYLRTIEPHDTYVVGLQTMVFAEAGQARDRDLIQRNVDWLVKARVRNGDKTRGWSYGSGGVNIGADFSNSQYALLGLHAGKQAGAKIDPEVWESLRRLYTESQLPEGGWGYQPNADGARFTMTVAGFCSLHIAGLELNAGRQELQANGVARNCGVYAENKELAKALRWIGDRFHFKTNGDYTFYNTYGIERAGRLSGQRFLGGHDWYREGCTFLVEAQRDDGSWTGVGTVDSIPGISTPFALLFLSKGRTPILVSKFAYGDVKNIGWNNKHHDARFLAEYASRELFNKKPMAWQVYDARQVDIRNEADLRAEVGELLQSPVVWMNGHDAPEFSDQQRDILRKYLEEGGFLFAEACCGRPEFVEGLSAELAKMFPGSTLEPLGPDHPIWTAHAAVPPTAFPKLLGLQQGCKTVAIVSPQPLAGWYEENQYDPTAHRDSRGPLAFRLAGNVIAYATGLEAPKPRLSRVELPDDKAPERKLPRGFLTVGQVHFKGAEGRSADWQPAPKAVRNLMLHLREQLRLDVSLDTKEVFPLSKDLYKFRLLYMHGRTPFEMSEGERNALRANLQNGGLLLADACCGSAAFDDSFRKFAAGLFPRDKFPDAKLEPIPLTDDLFSADLNGGTAIDRVRCRRVPGDKGGTFQSVEPALEGIKVNGRWVVIYSKYDIGCALEKHTSSDCLGHDHASALQLATAAVLYSLKR
jgi:hypothetical protein